jgi:hypothetical protein
MVRDAAGRSTEITVVAGSIDDTRAPAPPPRSWAARADTHVAIWTVRMEPGARWTLPPAPSNVNRSLYFFLGKSLVIAGRTFDAHAAVKVRPDAEVMLELLLLQGRPIAEPVVQYGPFVMNSREEIQQAIRDYQRTAFGGWPWPSDDPVHAKDAGRFAKHVDGRVERRG